MRVKICDVYNTKYFYITMGKDLNYMWNTCVALRENPEHPYNIGNATLGTIYECFKKGQSVEFDLADARITSDVVPIVMTALRKGIVMCDTLNPDRDVILKTNMERVNLSVTTVPMPEFTVQSSPVDYIKSLEKDCVYLPPVTNPEVYVPLVVMITILRPSVKFCLDNIGDKVLRFVAERLTIPTLKKYPEHYAITPEGIQVVNITNGVYDQRLGEVVDIETASTSAYFVPTEFGSVRLFDDPIFAEIFMECAKLINQYKATKKLVLSDIFK